MGMKSKLHPVPQEKIEFVKALLADPLVNRAWLLYNAMELPRAGDRTLMEARHRAWKRYCHYRDVYLGIQKSNDIN
jgi:hypothetical protein